MSARLALVVRTALLYDKALLALGHHVVQKLQIRELSLVEGICNLLYHCFLLLFELHFLQQFLLLVLGAHKVVIVIQITHDLIDFVNHILDWLLLSLNRSL